MIKAAASLCAVMFLFSTPLLAQKCECLPQTAAQEAQKNSSLVILADVLDKTRFSLPEIGPNYKEFKITARVRQYWKGKPERVVTLRSPDGDGECGIELNTGQRYLIYAIGTTMPIVTKCSRTLPADSIQARLDIERLGKGTMPEEED